MGLPRGEVGPVFIGGLANSGKTELRLMLEMHPSFCLTRRTYMWTRYYGHFGDLGMASNFEQCLARMLENKHIRALEPDVARIRREFGQGVASYARLFGLFHSHYAERMGKPRWGDQLGSVERYADPIFEGYPTAKIIQMIRNPRHVFEEARARSRQRVGKVGWMLAGWLGSIQVARRNQSRYPNNYKVVHYEAMISRPEETLQEVCCFLGEEYVPGLVAGLGMEGAQEKEEQRSAMSAREVAFVETYARQELLSLGYGVTPVALSVRDRLLYVLMDWPANRAGMVAWQRSNGGVA